MVVLSLLLTELSRPFWFGPVGVAEHPAAVVSPSQQYCTEGVASTCPAPAYVLVDIRLNESYWIVTVPFHRFWS